MDIDDILADVSDTGEPQEAQDLQALTRAWVSERVAPELLPYPAVLMERILERVRVQVCVVPHCPPSDAVHLSVLYPSDRASRDPDRQHGPQNIIYDHRPPDRARALQVPCAIFSTGSAGKGEWNLKIRMSRDSMLTVITHSRTDR